MYTLICGFGKGITVRQYASLDSLFGYVAMFYHLHDDQILVLDPDGTPVLNTGWILESSLKPVADVAPEPCTPMYALYQ